MRLDRRGLAVDLGPPAGVERLADDQPGIPRPASTSRDDPPGLARDLGRASPRPTSSTSGAASSQATQTGADPLDPIEARRRAASGRPRPGRRPRGAGRGPRATRAQVISRRLVRASTAGS